MLAGTGSLEGGGGLGFELRGLGEASGAQPAEPVESVEPVEPAEPVHDGVRTVGPDVPSQTPSMAVQRSEFSILLCLGPVGFGNGGCGDYLLSGYSPGIHVRL